jgi:hypothetical protein
MRILLAVASWLLLSTVGSLAYKAEVEGWLVQDFSIDKMVACIMGRSYEDGTRLSIVVSNTYEWALGAANQGWNLKKDATTDIAVYVDRKFVASGKARHLDGKSAYLPLSGSSPTAPCRPAIGSICRLLTATSLSCWPVQARPCTPYLTV